MFSYDELLQLNKQNELYMSTCKEHALEFFIRLHDNFKKYKW